MSSASAGTWDWSMAAIRTIRMMMTVMTGTKYWTVFKAIHHDESYFLILILVLECNFDMLGSSFVETPPKASCMSNCRLCEGGSDQLVINDRQSSICQLTEPRQLLELSAPNLKKSFTKFARQRCLLSIQGKYSQRSIDRMVFPSTPRWFVAYCDSSETKPHGLTIPVPAEVKCWH